MYQMSCNRSTGTGENQIIWCGRAAAAGKRCGRAAGGLAASLRRGAEGLRAPGALPPSPAPLLLPLRAGPERRRARRLPGARPSSAKRRSPVRYLRAPRGPTGPGLRAGSAAAEARPAPEKHLRGKGMGRTAARSCVKRLPFPSLLVPVSCLSELLSRAWGGRGNRPLPAPLPPGPSRTCGSRGSPPQDAPPRPEASRAPASLDGQHLPEPRAVSTGVSDSELVPEPFSRPQTCVGGRLLLGKAPRGAGGCLRVHGNLATCAGRSREGAVLPLQKETQLSKMLNEHYK